MIEYKYNLDMTPGKRSLEIPMKQYDTDFSIVFSLIDRKGELTLESGTTVKIRGTKADGYGYSVNATIDLAKKTVTATGDEQMTIVAGRMPFELSILKGTKILNTATFYLKVHPAALSDDADISESEISDFRQAINAAAQAEEAAEAAETAETAAQTAATAAASSAAAAQTSAAAAASSASTAQSAATDAIAAAARIPAPNVQGTDDGKVLTVDGTNPVWDSIPKELPNCTNNDRDKVLTVNNTGNPVWKLPETELILYEHEGDLYYDYNLTNLFAANIPAGTNSHNSYQAAHTAADAMVTVLKNHPVVTVWDYSRAIFKKIIHISWTDNGSSMLLFYSTLNGDSIERKVLVSYSNNMVGTAIVGNATAG